jgi:hypothetical protein
MVELVEEQRFEPGFLGQVHPTTLRGRQVHLSPERIDMHGGFLPLSLSCDLRI